MRILTQTWRARMRLCAHAPMRLHARFSVRCDVRFRMRLRMRHDMLCVRHEHAFAWGRTCVRGRANVRSVRRTPVRFGAGLFRATRRARGHP